MQLFRKRVVQQKSLFC